MRPSLRSRLLVLVIVSLAALGAAPAADAANITLYGTVGPTHAISLTTRGGVKVRSVTAGRAYTIVVRDRSNMHNFHLRGSGVARTTGIETVGTVTWTVRFRVGSYTYLCDAHPATMIGSITARAAS